jgi:MFS family permease
VRQARDGSRDSLRLIVGAIFLSALGDFLALTALALHVQEVNGSGIAVAGLFIALWLPLVVLAGHAGMLVDRLDTRRVLVVASLVQAGLAVGLAFTSPLLGVLVLTALLGSANAVAQPAEFALVPAAVTPDRVGIANAQVETARALGAAAGPLLGGLLAAAGGTRLPLLVDAVTFLAIAAGAAAVTLRPAAAAAAAVAEPLGRARDGIVFLARDRLLLLVMAVAFASLLFMTASAPAEVFFAKDVLKVGDVGFGAMWTCWFLGMALGGLLVARRVPAGALAVVALVAIVVQSVGVGAPTVWLSFPFALALYLIGGSAHGTKNVLVRTLMHARVPARLHGRAFAAYNGLRNGAEMVALALGGLLIAWIGARWTLFVAGAAPAAAGVVGLAAYRWLHAGKRDAGAAKPA